MTSKVRPNRIFAGMVLAAAVVFYAPASFAAAQSAAQAAPAAQSTLDYEFFKANVEPIFLKRRSKDHARCYVCHERSKHTGRPLSLEPLSPGSSFWNEEQSRRNFEIVSKVVVPGNPDASLFPMHPLAPEAGGDADNHQGGRQFESRNDPDFQKVVVWIRGQKAAGSSTP